MWNDIVLNAVHRWVRSSISGWKGKRWNPLHLLWDSSDKQSPRGSAAAQRWRWSGPPLSSTPPAPRTPLASYSADLQRIRFSPLSNLGCDAQSLHHAVLAGTPSPHAAVKGGGLSPPQRYPAPAWCRPSTCWPACSLSSPIFHAPVLHLAHDVLVFHRHQAGSLLSAFAWSFLFCLEGPNPLLPQGRSRPAFKSYFTEQPLQGVFAARVPTCSLSAFTFCSVHLLSAPRPWDTVAAPNVHFAMLFENVQFRYRRKQMEWMKLINMLSLE